jgi:hypothetical protein
MAVMTVVKVPAIVDVQPFLREDMQGWSMEWGVESVRTAGAVVRYRIVNRMGDADTWYGSGLDPRRSKEDAIRDWLRECEPATVNAATFTDPEVAAIWADMKGGD